MPPCEALGKSSVAGVVRHADLAAVVEPTGMILRGGFEVTDSDGVPPLPDGRPAHTVVIVGNVGRAMWPHFIDGRRDEPDPLDAWTRRTLGPIAESFGAHFLHPSDQPYRPFQRWAMRAGEVWPSPIGLLIDPMHGLWHALRGAFVFAGPVAGLPPAHTATSPCVTCPQPCLTACPVDAFTPGDYDHERCRAHIRSGTDPDCLHLGCAARRACPVNVDGHYGPDQMLFHMRAFTGDV
jgi:hypothetical protein